MQHWRAIAKAEFLSSSSKYRGRRLQVFLGAMVFLVVWAFVFVPIIIRVLLNSRPEIVELLRLNMSGFMRSVLLFLWITILIYPLSYALQEVRLSDWEIIISCNVKPWDIIIGKFVARLPVYSIAILALSPILVAPFVAVFQVSLAGQVLMYVALILVSIVTLWFSTVISSALRSALNKSQRGDSIARVLSAVLMLVYMTPMMGLVWFAGPVSSLMESNLLLLIPSTWAADIASWATVIFNGINLGDAEISSLVASLGFNLEMNLILLVIFGFSFIVIGYITADRVFTIEVGPRLESAKTAGHENAILRFIRRIWPGPFGTLVVSSFKDIFRRPQNVAKILLGVVMSGIIPVIVIIFSAISSIEFPPILALLISIVIMIMTFPFIGGLTFGGIGFLESRNHLWIIQSSPDGALQYVKARISAYAISAIPLAIVPGIGIGIFYLFEPLIPIVLLIFGFTLTVGASLIGTGVVSLNPTYDDTKSSSYLLNTFLIVIIIFATTLLPLTVGTSYFLQMLEPILGSLLTTVLTPIILSVLPMTSLGLIMCYFGAKHLSRPDK
ncbi:MAG: hypothetical protein ACFFFO_13725 [Candidatus Thorarchaeota archaeon]